MKPLYVINDLHLSAIRSGGTTPATATKLRESILTRFKELLAICDSDVLVNGDFADTYKMVPADLLDAYHTIVDWLQLGHKFYAIPGNHCLSKSTLDLSSFELLFRLLESQFPEQISLHMQPEAIRDGMYVLGHVPNQELLNIELAKVPACSYLFVHANYDNKFAVKSDHSLNISKEQAEESKASTIIFGHEHQGKVALAGKVIVVGNQIPTSVSDCLGNSQKYMLRIEDSGISKLPVWQAEGDFVEVSWRDLGGYSSLARFIRVIGTAGAEEAATAVSAIAKFRAVSPALVITNAIQIAGKDLDTQETLETLQGFDMLAAILEALTAPEKLKIQTLYEKHNAN
jgi:hypothetical protein